MIAGLGFYCFMAATFLAMVTATWPAASEDGSAANAGDFAIVHADAERFFDAVRAARLSDDRVGTLQTDYVDKSSPGFRYFDESGRFESAEYLWRVYSRYPHYYDAVEQFYRALKEQLAELAAPAPFIMRLYPGEAPPPVYLIVGHFRGGATAYEGGLVISIDNWAASWNGFESELAADEIELNDPVATLAPLIAHELVHFYQKCSGDCGTLLEDALSEGVADFVAFRITGQRTNMFQVAAYDHYIANEAELWAKFRGEMGSSNHGVWLYNNEIGELPHNMGYAVGFRIAQAYFSRQPEKDQALRDLIDGKPAAAILSESGYDPE